jgi:ABC-type glycerol-3-phosphate transport system substrate-binding protein
MKKAFVVMIAFMLGLAVTSCKQGQKSAPTAEEVAANPVEILNQLIENAQTEGANWSIDEWKEAYHTVFLAMSPAMKGMYEVMQIIQTEGAATDTVAINKAMAKAKDIEGQFGKLGDIVEKFDSIGKLYPNGKTVSEDKEFEKQCLKEIGLPEDFSL